MIARPSGVPDAGSMAGRKEAFIFREASSDLFIDFARQSTDVFPGSGTRREVRP
jgi:hypothetical protein